ncbi:MAG: hypothetical protein EOL89_09290 [Actinobacteria bacterium]|nr:hypothetical protein [Actinomycetota bacterium]
MARRPTAGSSARDDVATVAAFVVRARRIAAHTLAQDVTALQRQVGEWNLEVVSDGGVRITRSLPDEERFESFASRLRPLTLPSEPIWYRNVVAAVDRMLAAAGDDAGGVAAEWAVVRQQWPIWDLENLDLRGYYVRQVAPDVRPAATDAQLGAGWFYADVAHADPKRGKEIALAYPLVERYAAAVRGFSGLALVVLRTLRLIETLAQQGVVSLPESVWSEEVSVPVGELVREGTAFVAPAGTPLPETDVVLGPEWQPLSPVVVERSQGIFHLTARLLDPDGREISVRPAVTRRWVRNGRVEGMDLRVDDLVDLHLPVPGDPGDGLLRAVFLDEATSNTGLLRRVLLRAELRSTRVILLEDDSTGTTMARLQLFCELPGTLLEDGALREACTDLIALEDLTGGTLPLLETVPALEELVRLRTLRLVMSGAVTYGSTGPLEVTTLGEDVEVIQVPAHEEEIGGIHLAFPTLLLWHPQMGVEGLGGEPSRFRVSVPAGERFLMWAPGPHGSTAISPENLQVAPWDLDDLTGPTAEEAG